MFKKGALMFAIISIIIGSIFMPTMQIDPIENTYCPTILQTQTNIKVTNKIESYNINAKIPDEIPEIYIVEEITDNKKDEAVCPPETDKDKIEENKPEDNKPPKEEIKPKDPVYVVELPSNIFDLFTKPTETDFAEYYEDALRLYNAILNGEEQFEVYFDTGDSTANANALKQFITKFESNVLNNRFSMFPTCLYGAYTKLEIDTKQIHDEVLLLTQYYQILIDNGINNNTEKREALTIINNWMCKHIKYESGSNEPYIAFTKGQANCEGYARLFKRFCTLINVECTIETGRVKTSGEYGLHAWNKTKVEGQWLYTDVCWNDSKKPNKYLLSTTLWNNHTSKLDISVPNYNYISTNKTVVIRNKITSIEDVLNMPTEEAFGAHYEVAVALYNGIIRGDDITTVSLYKTNGDDIMTLWDDFKKTFENNVLPRGFVIQANSVSWHHSAGRIDLKVNTKKTYNGIMELINNQDVIYEIFDKLNITNNTNQKAAIIKILNYLANEMEYTVYTSASPIGLLKEKECSRENYAVAMALLCDYAGIEHNLIYGKIIHNGREIDTYWNQIKIGDKWYYSDIWYYFGYSYTNYNKYEYAFSETLWNNHKI